MKNKIKTNKSASKRFKITATGQVKFKRTKMRHRQKSKSKDLKRSLRKPGILKYAENKMVHKLLPYS